jgi:hypothetical protein
MSKSRKRLLIGMLIVAIGFIVVGVIDTQIVAATMTSQDLANNPLAGGIPFLLIFIGILLSYIDLIIFMATKLNNRISEKVFRPIERLLIAGIVLGIIGMFQPFVMGLYTLGFIVLFVSLLSYIAWSHIVPRGAHRASEIGSVSISEVEQHTVSE